jgi:outer membrane scaffolding protein for murein synthesis (MipA/OmpV family)
MKPLLLVLVLVLLAFSGFAGEVKEKDFKLSAGFAYAWATDYRKDNGASSYLGQPLPFVAFRWKNLGLSYDGLRYWFFDDDILKLNAMLSYTGERYYGVRMAKKYSSLFAGMEARVMVFPYLFFNGQALQDFQGRSNGLTVRYGLEYFFNKFMPDFAFSIEVLQEHWASRYVNYYFGVAESEEIAGVRAAYAPKSTYNHIFGLKLLFNVSGDVFLMSGVEYKIFGSAVRNSPTVMDGHQTIWPIGIFYKF